jgi:predicted transcriptional regulator YdeE
MGRISEGSKTAEAYGIRLPAEYNGEVPEQMFIINVPAAEYIVFEHGSFDYEQESESVGKKLQDAIDGFDYNSTDYVPDNSTKRISYFYFDPERYEKRVLPVKRK